MGLRSLFQRLVHGRKSDDLEFHIINAFTSREENTLGNPASICIVDEFPSDHAMGSLATTLNTAMTTFLRRTDKKDVYEVRHFSPDGNENHICGHALVAASEHLARTFPEFRQGRDITFLVNPKYKLNATHSMTAHISKTGISLTLPAVLDLQEVKSEKFYKALGEALNIPEENIVKPVYFAPRANNYLVVMTGQNDLISLKPDFKKLNDISHAKEFLPQQPGEDKIVPFWCLTAKSDNKTYDVMNRVFSPDIGVDEDPACGSANCSIIPYWSLMDNAGAEKGKKEFKVLYPYPPGGANAVGGVQHIKIDVAKQEITLTAEATFKKIVKLKIPAEKQKNAQPKPPGPV